MPLWEVPLWEVNSPATPPVMFCAHEAGWDETTEYTLIKALVKKAKKEGVTITTISVSVNDEGMTATLCGTRIG